MGSTPACPTCVWPPLLTHSYFNAALRGPSFPPSPYTTTALSSILGTQAPTFRPPLNCNETKLKARWS